MTTLLHISMWKKEIGECYRDILEESIEIEERDRHKIDELIEAIKEISKK
jgi:hypothetical protein